MRKPEPCGKALVEISGCAGVGLGRRGCERCQLDFDARWLIKLVHYLQQPQELSEYVMCNRHLKILHGYMPLRLWYVNSSHGSNK